MPRRLSRLDAELVRRGLARSREHAAQLIAAGRVEVRGVTATKPATGVDADASVRVVPDDADPGYASRGGHKLAGALQALPQIRVAGRRCLDAGASTGGFTDVLLRAGAAEVVAVDVGYGQLAWSLRTDERVRRPRPHQRPHPDPDDIGGPAELTVADLSFISLPHRAAGAHRLHRRRRRPAARWSSRSSRSGASASAPAGWSATRRPAPTRWSRSPRPPARSAGTPAVSSRSPLPGPSGNVEFFLWLRRDGAAIDDEEIIRIVTAPAEQAPMTAHRASRRRAERQEARAMRVRPARRAHRPAGRSATWPRRPPSSCARRASRCGCCPSEAAECCCRRRRGRGRRRRRGRLRARPRPRRRRHVPARRRAGPPRRRPDARRQPRPRRLPRRGRAAGARRTPSRRSSTATTPSTSG